MSAADEIAKLAALRDTGDITEEEFNQQKAKVLSTQYTEGKAQVGATSEAKNMSGWKVFGLIVLALVVAFFGYGFIAANSPEGKARAHDRAAIELCWKDYERKGLDATQKKFIAGTCNRMAEDFKQKHGREP